MAKKEKCTRLFYNDEKHIKIYEALPPEQFKELIMAMLTYKYGDEEFLNTIKDPVVKALFIGEKVDIDRNEEEWIRRKEIYKQNGSKGGRPPKEDEEETRDDKNRLEDWYLLVKEKDDPKFFNATYSQYFNNISDAKKSVMLRYGNKYIRSWLL